MGVKRGQRTQNNRVGLEGQNEHGEMDVWSIIKRKTGD